MSITFSTMGIRQSLLIRTRKYGNKSLPLPPIMDPIAIAGKQKHMQMKERVVQKKDELSELQQKLRLNPHGTDGRRYLVILNAKTFI